MAKDSVMLGYTYIHHPNWHQWVQKAMKELGDGYKYKAFRALIREYYRTDRMMKFLKVGEYEEKK